MKANNSPSRSARRNRKPQPQGALFLGTKALGELRILMRLAAKVRRPVIQLPAPKPAGADKVWRDAA